MTNEDEEEAFISALREGDIVLHPERHEWMCIGRLEDGLVTEYVYEQGKDPRKMKEPYRRLWLYQLDRDPWETPIPFELYYRDIEQRIIRKKLKAGE